MKSYKYTLLSFRHMGGAGLGSTDSQVLDCILAELKKVITDFRVSADKLPSVEKYWHGSLRVKTP